MSPRRGHPVVFMLAAGTGVTAIVHGDVGTAVVCALVVAWTFRGASSPAPLVGRA